MPPAREMALQASLGTSLTWAKRPVKETGTAWARALDLARRISDLETQLQAHYGLWLYDLRCGRYVELLGHATQMIELAEIAGDQKAIAAGQRIAGVSHHFLGRHAEARVLIETALRWYEQSPTAQAFRFGLDQQVAGLAFLSRILWVQGFSGDAIQAASDAVERARALDHACTLCCAMAEGWCMVHALNGDDEAVEKVVAALLHTASKQGWQAYGDVFGLWVAARKNADAIASDHLDSVTVGGLALTAVVLLGFRETLAVRADAGAMLPRLLRGYRQVMTHREVVSHILVNGLAFGWAFAYVAGSPLVLISLYHVAPIHYALLFACTGGGIVAGAMLNGRLARRGFGSECMLLAAILLAVAVTLVLVGLSVLGGLRLPVLMPLLVLATFCFGLAAPSAAHGALGPIPNWRGGPVGC